MTSVARLLRFDSGTWRGHVAEGSLTSAVLVAMGAYAILAFDRFGVQGVMSPRGTVRMLLTGFYGWLWLAVAAWLLGRWIFTTDASFGTVFRLYGYAHLPLLVLAIAIQIFAVFAQVLGPSMVIGIFVGLFWLPTMLVAATRQALDLDWIKAAAIVAGPYLVWLLIVGRSLYTQVGHLL